ncbi:MAG TPA: hypothetical protein VN700_18150 [Vicinamibacterales bacterium]|nr:hypothetical protein [Vicinamibacterales bacterium]
MKDRLAEKVLARVLGWTTEEVAQERPTIQALAAYKYDEYQQFFAGSRFIESLALWLDQFVSVDERRIAYNFVRERLIFWSSSEIRHLVEIAYPDYIRPILLERSATSLAERYQPSIVADSTDFLVRQRQCLFLGLSDGARIDVFRRANAGALNHEQISHTHELSNDRVGKLLTKLDEHLSTILERPVTDDERRFKTLVLLDDFSASGTSYYSLPAAAPGGGKVKAFFDNICDSSAVGKLVDLETVDVIILLYLATEQAVLHLRQASASTWGSKNIKWSVDAVQVLSNGFRVGRSGSDPIHRLINDDRYYDPAIHDVHMRKGGAPDSRYGYGDCGLPLVLHHNTPNNSLFLLMSYEDLHFRGLFPRVRRHSEVS